MRDVLICVFLFLAAAGCRKQEAPDQRVDATATTRSDTVTGTLSDDVEPVRPDDEQVPMESAATGSQAPTATAISSNTTTAESYLVPPSASATPQKEIVIDSVGTANPLVVKGRARTFENAVTVRVRDARGALVAEEHVTSRGEMGNHNPFEAQLWIVREPGARLTIEAFEFSAKDGSVRSLATKDVDYQVTPIAMTLTFPRGDCTKFGAVTRKVPKSVAMARLMVEALLAGPTAGEKNAGATSPFPAGSDVRSVILRDGVMTVDLNERLRNVGGACAGTAIRESLTRTLKQLPTVKRVVITAGGSAELALQP